MPPIEEKPRLVGGVYAALATPRQANSMEADAGALLDYLDTVGQAGVDGLVLFGSTGEFIHFDLEERMRVLGLAIRRSRVPILVNVSHSTLAGAVQLAESAASAEAAGLLLMPPYYYRYGETQIDSFYESFLKEIGTAVPLYLYNIPSCTNAIPTDVAAKWLMPGAFAGIKDSSEDMTLFEALNALPTKHEFSYMVGNDASYLRKRRSGADGVVSGVAAAVPELLVALDRAIVGENSGEADRLNARLDEFLSWVEKFPATVAIKQAAAHRGWPLDHFAFPLGQSTDAELLAFRRWLENWLRIVLAECA